MIIITTERFRLRPFRTSDADAYYDGIFADERITNTMTGLHHHPDREHVDDMIRAYAMFWKDNVFGPLAVIEDDTFVGSSGLTNYRTTSTGEVELAYALTHPHIQDESVAVELIQAWLRYAFETLGVRRVVSYTYAADQTRIHALQEAGLIPLHPSTVTEELVTTYVMTADEYTRPLSHFEVTTA